MLSVMSVMGQQEESAAETERVEGNDPNPLEPLLCFKGHGGWISGRITAPWRDMYFSYLLEFPLPCCDFFDSYKLFVTAQCLNDGLKM